MPSSRILGSDEVCSCLSETGERQVRVYERCERCGALMESDFAAENERLRQALEKTVDIEDFKERFNFVEDALAPNSESEKE